MEWSRSENVDALDNLEILQARYTARAFPVHAHREYVIGVITEGAEAFEHGRRRHVVQRGEIFLLNPYEQHTGRAAGADWQLRDVSNARALQRARPRSGPAAFCQRSSRGPEGGALDPRASRNACRERKLALHANSAVAASCLAGRLLVARSVAAAPSPARQRILGNRFVSRGRTKRACPCRGPLTFRHTASLQALCRLHAPRLSNGRSPGGREENAPRKATACGRRGANGLQRSKSHDPGVSTVDGPDPGSIRQGLVLAPLQLALTNS